MSLERVACGPGPRVGFRYWTGSLGSAVLRAGQSLEQAAATLGLSACSSAVKEAVGQLVSVTPENTKKIASGVDRRGCLSFVGAGLA